MTVSDVGEGSVVTAPSVTPPNRWKDSTSSDELVNMQYSPNTAAVNGYAAPYSSPLPAEVTTVSPELSPDKLPDEELRDLLRHQLEFYFSRLASVPITYLM